MRLRRVDIESSNFLEDLPPSYSMIESMAFPVHSADIQEASHLSEDYLEDLPPSYSTLEVLQNGPKYFKT